MNGKKKKNTITVIAVAVMLLAALAVLLMVRGLPNFSKDKESKEEKEAKEQEASQFGVLGEWQAKDNEDYIIDVWKDGEGEFHAIVNYSEKEDEVYFWEMSGSWQEFQKGFSYGDCKKTRVTYDSEGKPTEEVIYTDGEGSITANGDSIKWKDKKEKFGDKVTFEYVGEY